MSSMYGSRCGCVSLREDQLEGIASSSGLLRTSVCTTSMLSWRDYKISCEGVSDVAEKLCQMCCSEVFYFVLPKAGPAA